MKKIINYSELGQILDVNLSGGRCAWKKLALDNGGKNIYGTDAQFPQNRLITDAEKEAPSVIYTIRFLAKDKRTVLKTLSVPQGESFTASDVPTPPVITDYTFVKWSPNINYTPTRDATYVAKYEYSAPHTGSIDEYFTTTIKSNGTITFNINSSAEWTVGQTPKVAYRVSDGSTDAWGDYIYGNWVETNIQSGQNTSITVPDLHNGYIVQWKGNATRYASVYWRGSHSYFSSTCNFEISNNILTLLYYTDVESLTLEQKTRFTGNNTYCFCALFDQCTGLTKASELYLPTFLDGGEHHFTDMFRECTNLTEAGFTVGKQDGTLRDSAYERMFLGCSSLTVPPTFPCMNLGIHCYQYMFSGCTSLVNGPILPAINMVAGCYDGMFGPYTKYAERSEMGYATYDGCTSLQNVTMLGTYYSDANAPEAWYLYVGPNQDRTLIHPLDGWLTNAGQSNCVVHGDTGWNGSAYIPSNWTVTTP